MITNDVYSISDEQHSTQKIPSYICISQQNNILKMITKSKGKDLTRYYVLVDNHGADGIRSRQRRISDHDQRAKRKNYGALAQYMRISPRNHGQ